MRSLLLSAFGAAVLLLSCVSHEIPPPPAHPVVEGNWGSFSHADIHAAIAVVRHHFVEMRRPDFPIYRVNVVDRNHIEVYFHPPVLKEEGQLVERVKGKWQLGEERIISTWENLPTSMLSPVRSNQSLEPTAGRCEVHV
jgi:hypothetical protein